MTDETQAAAPRRSRWLVPALVVSLAVNALVLGGLGAAAWRHKHGHGFRGGADETGLMGFTRHLTGERRAAVREQLTSARAATLSLRQSVAEAWRAANATLAAEPYDKAAVAAAMDKLAQSEAALRTAVAVNLSEIADKLTPEERRELREWRERHKPRLLKHLERGEGRGERHGRGKDDD